MPFSRKIKSNPAQVPSALLDRMHLLDVACGVGLWEGVLVNGDSYHPDSKWWWSAELRRLLGYESEVDFPNLVGSWADKLHPEDMEKTFEAFSACLKDRTGTFRYTVTYRLQTKGGAYRWFRASGGCLHGDDGKVRACGSLVEIDEQMQLFETMERNARDDDLIVSELGLALTALAEGNLAYRITSEALPEKSDRLREDFHIASSKLAKTLLSVRATIAKLSRDIRQITEAFVDLSRRTERQAASLEETSSALQEFTEAISSAAVIASKASEVADEASASAEKSGAVVKATVCAMDEIHGTSIEIAEITRVIDKIAFQTNLLALNAGVEAARAGDAGRGFAVVAHEVRELSQRTVKAADRIKELISTSTTKVEQGVELVGSSGHTLNGMTESINLIAGRVNEIASASFQQSTKLRQINDAVRDIDRLTQQNAAMVEETTSACVDLGRETAELEAIVELFNFGEDGEYYLQHEGSRTYNAA